MKQTIEKVDFDQNISPENKRDNKREALYDQIKEKVDLILELRKFAEENENDNNETLGKKINEKWHLIVNKLISKSILSEEDIASLNHQLSLIDRYKELNVKIMETLRSLKNEDQSSFLENAEKIKYDPEYSYMLSESVEIKTEIENFDKNNNLRFVKNIMFFLKDISLKRALVLEGEKDYKDKEGLLIEMVAKECGLNLNQIEKNKYKIIFQGYSIIIELEKEEFESLVGSPDTTAFHASNSPLIVLKNREGKESSLKHEKNHNLSDSFVDDINYSGRLLASLEFKINLFRTIEDNSEKGKNDKDVLKFKEENIRKINDELAEYAYNNFAEIIADIDNIADHKIFTYLNNYIDSVEKIEELISTISSNQLKSILENGVKEMNRKFIDYLKKLSNIFFVEEKIGDVEEAKGAVLLFKHKQINKVEKYFKHKHGADLYELTASLQPLVCNGIYFNDLEEHFHLQATKKVLKMVANKEDFKNFKLSEAEDLIFNIKQESGVASFFDIENLKKIVLFLQDTKLKLSDEDLEKIEETLKRANWAETVLVNKINLGNIIEIDKYLKIIAEKLSINGLSKIAEQKMSTGLINFYLFSENYEELQNIYSKWPFEKDMFQFWVAETLMKVDIALRTKMLQGDKIYDFLNYIDADEKLINLIKGLPILEKE